MAFFVDDICQRKGTSERGFILATFLDTLGLDDPQIRDSGHVAIDASITNAQAEIFSIEHAPPHGTVIVDWFGAHVPQLISTSALDLVSRPLTVGDVVTGGAKGGLQGVVIKTTSGCTLKAPKLLKHADFSTILPAHCDLLREAQRHNHVHAMKLTVVDEGAEISDISIVDLVSSSKIRQSDFVMWHSWVGMVEDVLEEIGIRLFNNSVVKLPSSVVPVVLGACSAHNTFALGDVVTVRKSDLRLGRWIYGAYDPNVDPVGVVITIQPELIRVQWQVEKDKIIAFSDDQAPPDELGPDEMASPHFRLCDEELRGFQANPSATYGFEPMAPENRVVWRDFRSASERYASTDIAALFANGRVNNLGVDMNIFSTLGIQQVAQIRWQDSTMTLEDPICLEIVLDHEVGFQPADVVTTLAPRPDNGEASQRIGIAQSVDPVERLVTVKWFADPKLGELNNTSANRPPHALGELSTNVEVMSVYEVETPDGLDFSPGKLCYVHHSTPVHPNLRSERAWFGRLVDSHLDGSYSVVHSAVNPPVMTRVHIDNLSLPFTQQLPSLEDSSDHEYDDMLEDDPMWDQDDSDKLSEDDLGRILMGPRREETLEYITDGDTNMIMTAGENDNDGWSTDSDHREGLDTMEISSNAAPARPVSAPTPALQTGLQSPPAYQMLHADVPSSHRFLADGDSRRSAVMRKVMKEHAILNEEGAIPSGVFVRSWDSRADMFRAVIIGALGTPYARCPFVFDILLPSTYPATPPKFHFYDWSLGDHRPKPRINPNLYEDGYVCLSLLNTWPGRPGEGWQPGKSTLLQALISIQSLILVSEPFYNEPGYEERRSDVDAQAHSIAFNERVLLQSREFLEYAMARVVGRDVKDSSLEGLEDVFLEVFCRASGSKLLQEIIDADELLIKAAEESANTQANHRDGHRRADPNSIISRGAGIVLKKALQRLIILKDKYIGDAQ